MREPNFFIVGAAKSGTTTLYDWLSYHPEVFMPTLKEPHYFCYDEIKNHYYYKAPIVGEWGEYIRLFEEASCKHKAVGEATVHYLSSTVAAANIKEAIPHAKIVIMLREPISRAYSHYLMDRYRLAGMDYSFDDVLFNQFDSGVLKYRDEYLKLGNYACQVKRYLDTFGEKSVFIGLFDDMKKNPSEFMRKIYDFLEIHSDVEDFSNRNASNMFLAPKSKLLLSLYKHKNVRVIVNNIVPSSVLKRAKSVLFSKNKPQMSIKARDHLKQYYFSELVALQGLTDLDLTCWIKQYE